MRLNPKPSKVVVQVIDPNTMAKTVLFDTSISEVVNLFTDAVESECSAVPKWTSRKRKKKAAAETEEVAA